MLSALLTHVRKFLQFSYNFFWSLFKPLHMPFKKSKFNLVQIKKMNRIMKSFYRDKLLKIDDFENLEFFTFKSEVDDKLLSGVAYTPNKNSNKWIISMHWFAGDKFFGLYHALFLTKMGYNILSFDFRGHGKSSKDTTTMGLKEIRDLLGSLKWLKEEKNPESIVLFGTSMGAYIVNYFSFAYPNEIEKYNIKFGIADCPYGSLENLYIHERNVYLKFIPKKSTKKIVNWLIEKSNKLERKNNIDLFDSNIFDLISQNKIPKFPIFFSHAKNDLVTPPFDTLNLVIQRKDLIKDDDYIIYNYCMHTQALRTHFKNHVNHICNYVAKQDNNQEDYLALKQAWELDKFTSKKDLKDKKLS